MRDGWIQGEGPRNEASDGEQGDPTRGDPTRGDETTPTWERAHAELLRLAATRARLDAEEARWLTRALRAGTHVRLGYASFGEYIERLFGYSPRWTAEKLRVAEALEELRELSSALENAELSWSTARELTRVATPETEGEWLAAAHGRTARDVERLVSGHRPGSLPSDEADPSATRHVLRFEVTSETLVIFREAQAKLRRDASERLDDDAALLSMARCVLEGPKDEGRASYQVALTVCEECRRGRAEGRGELVGVDGEIVEMAECDAERFAIDAHVGVGRAAQSIPPAVRRKVMRRDAGRCRVPGCRHAVFVDVHHIDARADGGSHDAENLIVLCGAHHRALHRGEITDRGRATSGLTFRHADGSDYGSRSVSPKRASSRARAFRALRALGFREREAHRALDRAVTHVGAEADTEALVRRALAELVHVPTAA